MDIEKLIQKALDREIETPWAWPEPLSAFHRLLYTLTEEMQPENAIEIGVRMGPGVMHMALGNLGTEVWGFDVKVLEEAARVEAYFDNVHIYEIDGVEGIKTLTGGKLFGLAHLDSIHYAYHVASELEAIHPKMLTGGVICIDDIRLFPDMSQHWDAVICNDTRFVAHEDVRLHPWKGPTKTGVSYGVLEVL